MRLLRTTSGRDPKKRPFATSAPLFGREGGGLQSLKSVNKKKEITRAIFGQPQDGPCLWDVGRLLVVRIIRAPRSMKLAVFVCSTRQRRREGSRRVSRWRAGRDHPARVGGASVSITRGRHSFLFILFHRPPLASLFRVGSVVVATLRPRREPRQSRPSRELQSMGELGVSPLLSL